ncbi:MAG TPA: HAMP domain-containing sensor histidine kinase [Acidimicrobiales bacterium]|nr:HAMP domain-containing sensor histidine kinase [Acidimicrobiales bacterium]
MRLSVRGRVSRRDLLGALRVAAIATALIAVSYAGVVAVLDYAVAQHLTGQVDRQLSERLASAVHNPVEAFASSGVQTNGARYGLGIYGEPIALWGFARDGDLTRSAPEDPLLPAGTGPPPSGHPLAYNYGIAGTTYRLEWLRTRTGWLLAGESLTELGHVEAVLVTSEAIALPFLLLAFFFVALAIGLRSARPVEASRRRQLEFTADASHELRTPLSVIEAEVSLARSLPRTAGEYEATLERVAAETQRLRLIVEDLLWLARLDSEPSPPASETVDLAEVARRCVGRFGAIASSRSQALELRLEGVPERPLTVVAPPEWLDKLAGTLADNACRYAPEGGTVRISALADGPARVALRVEDDGPGIDEADRAEIVRRFRRATTERGGHGLGLAIADSVARGTGGRLAIAVSGLGGALLEVSWPAAGPVALSPPLPARHR